MTFRADGNASVKLSATLSCETMSVPQNARDCVRRGLYYIYKKKDIKKACVSLGTPRFVFVWIGLVILLFRVDRSRDFGREEGIPHD